jgi:hypothetical protein
MRRTALVWAEWTTTGTPTIWTHLVADIVGVPDCPAVGVPDCPDHPPLTAMTANGNG